MSAKRLNREECRSIAYKMTSSISNELKVIEKYFSDLSRQLLESKVPEPILSLFYGDKKFSDFINTRTSDYLYFGKRYTHSYFDAVPSNNDEKSLVVPEIHLEKANKMYDERKALETKQKLLIKELEDVLYKLATPKRITEHLPEALPFLPNVEENMLPQINLTQFREKLKTELGF